MEELEKQGNEYHESAKQLLKQGDKNKAKNILVKKKRCVEKKMNIKGLGIIFSRRAKTYFRKNQTNSSFF